jgi:hypothetical protein
MKKYITTIMKKSIWISWYNSKAFDKDYALQEVEVKVGESCYVRIHTCDDGRVYYSYFMEIRGEIYSYTCMISAKGELYPNCGIVTYADELEMKQFISTQKPL